MFCLGRLVTPLLGRTVRDSRARLLAYGLAVVDRGCLVAAVLRGGSFEPSPERLYGTNGSSW